MIALTEIWAAEFHFNLW